MLANLQALRALAAVAVVIFHFGLMPATKLPFAAGAAGVDLFFVLSGFIIAHSTARDAWHFLARRLVRILPVYWIATIIASLFTLQNMHWSDASGWLVQSLFYLPGPQGRPALIFVAWTLAYELAFYLLYWVALRSGASRAPGFALILLLVFTLVHLPGLAGPWPLLLEFSFGVSIHLAVERFNLAGQVGAGVGLLIAGAGLLLVPVLPHLSGYNPDDYQSLGRVLTWGVPAGCIVLGAVLAERGGLAIRNRPILLAGAASYSVYLLHPIAVGQLLQLSPNQPPLSWVACLGAAAGIVALSIGFHLTVEAPLLRTLRGLLGDRPPIEQQVLVAGKASGGES